MLGRVAALIVREAAGCAARSEASAVRSADCGQTSARGTSTRRASASKVDSVARSAAKDALAARLLQLTAGINVGICEKRHFV